MQLKLSKFILIWNAHLVERLGVVFGEIQHGTFFLRVLQETVETVSGLKYLIIDQEICSGEFSPIYQVVIVKVLHLKQTQKWDTCTFGKTYGDNFTVCVSVRYIVKVFVIIFF